MSASTCPRCGAPMLALQQLADIAVRADAALLVLPPEARRGARNLLSRAAHPEAQP